jgi:hypothetical protein
LKATAHSLVGIGNYRLRGRNARYDLDREGFWSRDKF